MLVDVRRIIRVAAGVPKSQHEFPLDGGLGSGDDHAAAAQRPEELGDALEGLRLHLLAQSGIARQVQLRGVVGEQFGEAGPHRRDVGPVQSFFDDLLDDRVEEGADHPVSGGNVGHPTLADPQRVRQQPLQAVDQELLHLGVGQPVRQQVGSRRHLTARRVRGEGVGVRDERLRDIQGKVGAAEIPGAVDDELAGGEFGSVLVVSRAAVGREGQGGVPGRRRTIEDGRDDRDDVAGPA